MLFLRYNTRMDRKKLLKILVVLMIFMYVFHSLATQFYWYSLIWWLDMPMHFLGGIWQGLFFIYVFNYFFSQKLSSFKLISSIILCVLLIGIFWEIFEFVVYNHIGQNPFIILDTISDLCFDLAGGTFSLFYFYKRIMFTDMNTVQ